MKKAVISIEKMTKFKINDDMTVDVELVVVEA